MVLGLIAVFSAIVYKVNAAGEAGAVLARGASAAPVTAPISIPAGARLVSTALDGERALLHLEAADGAVTLLLVDLATGTPIGTYPLAAE